jgi:hypothetical protein
VEGQILVEGAPLILFTRNTRQVSWRHYPEQTPRFYHQLSPVRIAPVINAVSVYNTFAN